MTRYTTWSPARWPSLTACEACKANEDKQVLPGHRGCLPSIEGRFTADRTPVQVTVGLRVWDYNLRQGTVVEVAHHYDGTPDSVRGVVAWHLVREDDSGPGGSLRRLPPEHQRVHPPVPPTLTLRRAVGHTTPNRGGGCVACGLPHRTGHRS